MTAYFAYGMNLDPDYMHGNIPVEAARLVDYELVFRQGLATIQPAPGKVVLGAVWEVSDEGMRSLDSREGAPRMYHRQDVVVEWLDGGTRDAVVYLPNNLLEHREAPPGHGMHEIIRRGYEYWGLDLEALEAAVTRAQAAEDWLRGTVPPPRPMRVGTD